jgi:hypothetical protein
MYFSVLKIITLKKLTIKMKFSPIVLFVYSRLDHTVKTINALLKNHNVHLHDLIIYSDGPRSNANVLEVKAVRGYLDTIAGFNSVKIIFSEINLGLSKSIINGVSEVLTVFDSVIVLEDDLVTSPYFLQYMNEGLQKYQFNERVSSIHGYVYPLNVDLEETFFMRGADCWGWGTWRRAWNLFNPDGAFLLNELERKKLIYEFDFHGSFPYSIMLKNQILGKNDSWAIRWHASVFLDNKLTLYPARSLVQNIGHDGSGQHCAADKYWEVQLSDTPIIIKNIDVKASTFAFELFGNYLRKAVSRRYRYFRKLRMIFYSIFKSKLVG